MRVLSILLLLCGFAAAQIPDRAHQYRPALTREARAAWGMDAPIVIFAGQLHQESAWRADARSIYADGLAQFTKDTAADMARWYPELGAANAFDPQWAMRAMVRYDARLYDQVWGNTACDMWWATLRAYNGGLGHWRTEAKKAIDPNDRHSIDKACGTAKRSVKHCPESLSYPRQILLKHAKHYESWGGANPCLN